MLFVGMEGIIIARFRIDIVSLVWERVVMNRQRKYKLARGCRIMREPGSGSIGMG